MLNRRSFIRNGCTAILAPSITRILSPLAALGLAGCAHQENLPSEPDKTEESVSLPKEPLTIYPPLTGKKVQPPADGCYIGFFNDRPHTRGIKWDKTPELLPKTVIAALYATRSVDFPVTWLNKIDEQMGNCIPFLYSSMLTYINKWGFSDLTEKKEFAQSLAKYAQDLRAYGKPMYFCTMRELNGSWFPWGGMPDTAIKTWRFMHKVFEDNGANEYATWVWEVYCPFPGPCDVPNRYYPGDEYVDWIGLSAYDRNSPKAPNNRGSFEELVGSTYHQMRSSHKHKPIMMAEFASSYSGYQHRWLSKAYSVIKSWSGMKAAYFWNNVNDGLPDDHTLTEDSIKVLRELTKDPYFIWLKS